jgi:hypothetical protein
MKSPDPTKKILLSVTDGPEGIELYTSEDEAVVDWAGVVPALYLTVSTHDAYVKLGPFHLLLPKVKPIIMSGDLLQLIEAVILSRGPILGFDALASVSSDALQLLEDWVVNRFGEE